MGKRLDEIKRLSEKGCIERFDDIAEITDKIMYTTVGELITLGNNSAASAAHDLLFFNNKLTAVNLHDIRFCNILNMTAQVGKLYDDDISIRYAAIAGNVLLSVRNTVSKVRLFLAISVKSFIYFIDKKSGTNSCSRIYNDIQTIAEERLNIEICENTTIGELFEELRPIMTNWNIRHPVEEFADRAMYCGEIIKMLMIDCMRVGYGELFDFEKLKKTLYEAEGLSADCDIYCDEPDDDDEDESFGVVNSRSAEYTDNRELIDVTDSDEAEKLIRSIANTKHQ